MSPDAEVPILIAGAGPAGLVLALVLLQNGVSVRIIDKEPNFRPGQRGAGLQARTLEIFSHLGILQDILAIALNGFPRRVYKLPGGTDPLKTVSMSPSDQPTPSTPYINGLHLGQYNTEAILRAHLEKLGCHVELGVELCGFEQYPDGVIAHVIKRAGDREESGIIRCHWLVGADGARGIVRKQLGLTFLGETREDVHAVVGEIEVKGLDFEHWHQWGDFTTTLLMLRPTENCGFFYLITGGKIDYAAIVADREALVRHFYAATDRHDLIVGEIKWISDFRPNIRMVNKFAEGRVFVAGDAAHVHSPTGGQGLNSSVQDSMNLGWKLALVEKGLSKASLLETYTEERLPVIAAMLQKTTDILNKTLEANANTGSGDDEAWRRGGALKQLGVNYRWSSIVVDERTPFVAEQPVDVYGGSEGEDLRAGDRAPDAPGLEVVKSQFVESTIRNTTSLFQIFRPSRHTVLIFPAISGDIPPLLEFLRQHNQQVVLTVLILSRIASYTEEVQAADLVLSDQHGHAYAGYGISLGCLTIVAVRPDGSVGGILLGLEGLQRYLSCIFSAV
ncbi:uncharacterized protein FIBRA_07430 [Fibroporia radiculosa]|uniref:FAD-binding domain-containing protein n=1 Tax=Fibroporia radiculosa TaxID=599839 RepID=J4GUZ1_9APHY|nr:uncharacterized protein FIBRA_07430 [Fibroporia radiculosa]CCM05220.1 predicted protein [Fibroporia radiculosa]